MIAGKKHGTKKRCLVCGGKAEWRGLCGACLKAFHRAVAAGNITECEAIAGGTILPARRGRTIANPMRADAFGAKQHK
jgi:hypothetical protein